MSSASASPIDDDSTHADTNKRGATGFGGANGNGSAVPKPKRIACVICRRRKLKCDGTKPSCSTCTRLGHDCAYDEVRRKSGPKRGYVKALEERLKEVERQLKTQETAPTTPPVPQLKLPTHNIDPGLHAIGSDFGNQLGVDGMETDKWGSPQMPLEGMEFPSFGGAMDDPTFTWEMIGLGLEEPLPQQDTIDELQQIYFDKIHPSMPMIHKFRYLAAMSLAPNQRPPVCLRYAMWTHAASVTDKFMDLKNHFYQRARKYLELDYMKGHGEGIISLAHAQTHVLLASYEFRMMYFPRAWMNCGAGTRLSQMMSLHKQDGTGLEVKQTLPNPRDWTEREERRRTFWMTFCQDRYASIGTGWPMAIDERDIFTDLPASDEAFDMSKPERTQSLVQAMNPSGASKLSSFGGVVLMASLFGRNLIHLHRPDPDEKDDDLNGEFWKRHRQMDNILLNTSLSMPSHLKLPNGLNNPNIVFTNMNIHTSTICLHQAAIYKADKNRLPASISAESKVRCITAANEIASVMRMISHMDLSSMNPFISFCLYVAARVFVQYLKSRPDDSQTGDSLRFLLSAMNALKRKNPLTESFLVQLDVDLESLGGQNEQFRNMVACKEDIDRMVYTQKQNQTQAGCNTLMSIGDCTPARGLALETNGTQVKDLATVDYSDRQQSISATGWGTNNGRIELDASRILEISDMGFGPKGLSAGGFVVDGSTSGGDTGRSPGTTSNDLTSNSTTPSESHHSKTTHVSHGFGISPSATSQHVTTSTTTDFFSVEDAFSGLQSGDLTHNPLTDGNGNGANGFEMQGSEWQMGGGNGSGMTPLGPGVFRHLLDLGIDNMDIGLDGYQ